MADGLWRAVARRQAFRFVFPLAAGAAFFVLVTFLGVWRIHQQDSVVRQGSPLTLSLIQGNVPQDVKWSQQYQHETLEKYVGLSIESLRSALGSAAKTHWESERGGQADAHKPASLVPDMIIWPETAMPFYYPASPYVAEIRRFAEKVRIPVLTGIPAVRRLPEGKHRLLNRACLFFPEGTEASYDKEHLVPFGEYLPPFLDIDLFRPLLQGLGGFAKGDRLPLFAVQTKERADLKLGMLICYEAIFPEMAWQRVADGAQALLNISNDAWYDRTSAPLQHLHCAAMRAVEQHRWMARSTNTGITAFVDPLGRIYSLNDASGMPALFCNGHLTKTLFAQDRHTLYFHLHPWMPAAAFALLLLIACASMPQAMSRLKRKG